MGGPLGGAARDPNSQTALVGWYTVAIAGPLGLLAYLIVDLVVAGIANAVGGDASAALPLWSILPFQLCALAGAVLVIPNLANLKPDLAGTRMRTYATIVMSGLLGLLLGRAADSDLVIGVVAAAGILIVAGEELGLRLMRGRVTETAR